MTQLLNIVVYFIILTLMTLVLEVELTFILAASYLLSENVRVEDKVNRLKNK